VRNIFPKHISSTGGAILALPKNHNARPTVLKKRVYGSAGYSRLILRISFNFLDIKPLFNIDLPHHEKKD
jgi:hypothetical protein